MNFKKYHVSRNLFDKAWLTNDRHLSPSTGLPVARAGRIATINPIDVSNIDTVTLTFSLGTTGSGFFMYSIFSGNTLIKRVADKTSGDIIDVTNADALYICLYVGTTITVDDVQWIMLNTGSTALPYEPYGDTWHDTPHYIHNTATDTFTTLPVDVYADGNNATVGISGNTVQNGTPTPQNPIQPSECGDRTGNLFDIESWLISKGAVFSKDGNAYTFNSIQSMFSTPFYFSDTDIPVSISGIITDITAYNTRINLLRADGTIAKPSAITYITNVTKSENIVCAGLQFDWSRDGTIRVGSLMLNSGSTALPYEPYGYKIPISSASTTTPVYLGEVETTRKIKKLVLTGEESAWSGTDTQYWQLLLSDTAVYSGGSFCTHFSDVRFQSTGERIRFYVDKTVYDTVTVWKTYLAQQYAAGTPVVVWYVLAEPTTGIVNEPIRKIGDYADTVSGITIPTIAGANSFDVLTTLKPSEVTVNYKGWHPVQSVHERESGAWD